MWGMLGATIHTVSDMDGKDQLGTWDPEGPELKHLRVGGSNGLSFVAGAYDA